MVPHSNPELFHLPAIQPGDPPLVTYTTSSRQTVTSLPAIPTSAQLPQWASREPAGYISLSLDLPY